MPLDLDTPGSLPLLHVIPLNVLLSAHVPPCGLDNLHHQYTPYAQRAEQPTSGWALGTKGFRASVKHLKGSLADME